MGDALATFVEARCARENPNGESSVRVRPTSFFMKAITRRLAAAAIAEACVFLMEGLDNIRSRFKKHPELFSGDVSLLDVLYKDGLVPTYSFPKNVVSMNVENWDGKLIHKLERSLDVAINEYAPGRSIVVDKQTYLIGGIYNHTTYKKVNEAKHHCHINHTRLRLDSLQTGNKSK